MRNLTKKNNINNNTTINKIVKIINYYTFKMNNFSWFKNILLQTNYKENAIK